MKCTFNEYLRTFELNQILIDSRKALPEHFFFLLIAVCLLEYGEMKGAVV